MITTAQVADSDISSLPRSAASTPLTNKTAISRQQWRENTKDQWSSRENRCPAV